MPTTGPREQAHCFICADFKDYLETMTAHLWDFIVSHLMRPLRLSPAEMDELAAYLKGFVQSQTLYHEAKGKLVPWASAIVYFFSCLHLTGRERPFVITVERIQEVVQMPSDCVAEFKELVKFLQSQYLRSLKLTMDSIEQITF